MNLNKRDAYSQLVAERKACHACHSFGLTNPASWAGGRHDSDEIGPWTRWQNNLDSELLIVGQDWGDTKYFEAHEGIDDPHNPTNRTLMSLLQSIGYQIDPFTLESPFGARLLFTNAVLCLKQGGMQAKVPTPCFENCSTRFLRPLIDLANPRIVIALGRGASHAVARGYDVKLPQTLREAVAITSGYRITPHTTLFPAFHCGNRVLNGCRQIEQQLEDWKRIGAALAKQ